MCDGGVVTCRRSRSVNASAARQCRTAAFSEAWVCRTAFGSPVVPELNTSTASPAGPADVIPDSAAASGSSRCSMGISAASTGWSPIASAGFVRASACSTSALFQAGLIRNGRRADAPNRLYGDDELRPVGRHERDPLPGFDASRA